MEAALHSILTSIVNLAILAFEFMGVGVIILSGAIGILGYLRKDPLTRLKLAKGMAMGLEFKLGSEILRTVVVRDLGEIAIVGAIILLRAALTFLIHWEIKTEETQMGTDLNGAIGSQKETEKGDSASSIIECEENIPSNK
jgi:uncharacterized membrane protein